MRVLARLNGWWQRRAAADPNPPAAPACPPWQRIDRENWGRILASETGRRMLQRARAVHYRMLRAASADEFHCAQSAHAARGFEEAIVWLESLTISCAPDEQGAIDRGGPGESPAPETPAEASERELRELITRSSP